MDIDELERSTMPRTEGYQRARERAGAKYGFFVHALVYAAVMVLLVGINRLTSPGTIWFIWPLIGWGLAVAPHEARAFLLADSRIVDALTKYELRRSGADNRNESMQRKVPAQ